MVNKENIEPKSYPISLFEQKEETNNLAIILPGAGYTTKAPLLHYTTGLFHTKGFDVLHINYTFIRKEISDLNVRDFASDVLLSIESAIKGKKYNNYYLVAKSIGTKAIRYLIDNLKLKNAKIIWLTPLLQNDDVFNTMVNGNNKGLCVIGDRDSCYIVDRFEKLKNNQNLTLKVVEGGNHSLDLEEDPIQSIDILKGVISDINNFLS